MITQLQSARQHRKVYENNRRTIDQLKGSIRRRVEAIDFKVLRLVTLNVIKRA
jgi:hypothetical protein